MALNTTNSWTARPALARIVRVASLLLPFAFSCAAALLTQRAVDQWLPGSPWILGAALSLAVAMLVLFLGERLARRLLPLVMLLKLALLFPDQVPSRFKVALRSTSPRRLAKQLESGNMQDATAAERVLSLVATLSAHDRLTRGHSERVRAVTLLIADEMGVKGADRAKLEWAALLHDIGKVTVSPAILNKRGAPDDDEWAELRKHPGEGAPLAGELADWMGEWVHAIDQHHERFDGSGYPGGLHGKEIALSGRIVAVADAFEVMTAVRSYKSAMSVADARTELTKCAGSHFDPAVIRSFATLSLPHLHRSLGPASWAMSLPFRGLAVRLVQGASALAGGAAPSALVGLTALVAVSMTAVTAADALDGAMGNVDQITVIAETAAGASPESPDPDLTSEESEPDPADAPGAAVDPQVAVPGPTTDPDSSSTDPGSDMPSSDGEPSADGPSRGTSGAAKPVSTTTNPVGSDDSGLETPPLIDGTTDLVDGVANETTNAAEQAVDLVGGTTEQVIDSTQTVVGTATDVVNDVIDTTNDTVATVADPVTDLVNGVIDTTQTVADTATGVVNDVIDTTNDTVANVADPVTDVVNDALDDVVSNLPTEVPVISALPTVAVPTVAIPTVAVPTVAIPTVAIPQLPVEPLSAVATSAPAQPQPVVEVVEATPPPILGLGG